MHRAAAAAAAIDDSSATEVPELAVLNIDDDVDSDSCTKADEVVDDTCWMEALEFKPLPPLTPPPPPPGSNTMGDAMA